MRLAHFRLDIYPVDVGDGLRLVQRQYALLRIQSLVEGRLRCPEGVLELRGVKLCDELVSCHILPVLDIDLVYGAHAAETERRAAVLLHFAHIVLDAIDAVCKDSLGGDSQGFHPIALLASAASRQEGGKKYGNGDIQSC